MTLGRRLLTIGIGPVSLEYDRDYGIDRRNGWSIVCSGRVLANIEPWLVAAIWKAWQNWRLWE